MLFEEEGLGVRMERDAKLITTSSGTGSSYSAGRNMKGVGEDEAFDVYWVPYVHFGV